MTRDGTGVSENIVNQMLAKIDGMNGLNNILLIGMTNRKDMLDTGLLRSGRLELHVEIGLPDEAGRIEILNIHTTKMRESGFLDDAVSMQYLASQTPNFSGAELEALVKAASSNAMSRKVDLQNLANCSGFEDIHITKADFDHALSEIEPLFGQDSHTLDKCMEHGIIEYSPECKYVLRKLEKLVSQACCCEGTALLSVLLTGPPGSGKTAMSAHVARLANFPFSRRIASEDFAGNSEQEKVMKITQVFDDAQKSPLSVVILDDMEHLMDYATIGPRFSNGVLQLFFSMLKRKPVKPGHRMLIIGTSSEINFIRTSKLMRAFNVTLQLPMLSDASHFHDVLHGLPLFTPAVLQEVCAGLHQPVGIQTVLRVAQMVTHQYETVDANQVLECFGDCGVLDELPDCTIP